MSVLVPCIPSVMKSVHNYVQIQSHRYLLRLLKKQYRHPCSVMSQNNLSGRIFLPDRLSMLYKSYYWRLVSSIPRNYSNILINQIKIGLYFIYLIPLCLQPLMLFHAVNWYEWEQNRCLIYICLILWVFSVCSVLAYFKSAGSAEHNIYNPKISD